MTLAISNNFWFPLGVWDSESLLYLEGYQNLCYLQEVIILGIQQ